MAFFYNTQNNFKTMGIGTSNSIELAKNELYNSFYNTVKSQPSNYSTFQNTFGINKSQEKNTYNIMKLQYTLVSDFLSKINLSYTLKSLNYEIKPFLNPATAFSPEEISELIPKNNPDLNFQSNTFNKNPFLDTINSTYLYSLINANSNFFKSEKETQTDDINNNVEDNPNMKKNNFKKTTKIDNPKFIQDIDEKLKEIDENFKIKIKKDYLSSQSNLIESKFMKYKNELEKKYKEDLQNEIERIKSVEIGKVIIEENKKYLEKIENIRNEYEYNYQLKLKELNEKEKEIKEKGNSIQDEYKEKTRELMEEFQKKTNEFITKESNFNEKCIKELKYIKEKKINLDIKEKELFILKKDYDKELSNEIEKIKNELKEVLKEFIEKLKYENEQELAKVKNKLKLRIINYDLSLFEEINNKPNEINLKDISSLKEEISELLAKVNKYNKNNLLAIDNDFEKMQKNLNYYEQISNLESKLYEIINKSKFKFYNKNKQENEKNENDIIIKDEKIRKKVDELENEQNKLNEFIEKDFKKMINEEIPKIDLNRDELEIIKNNEYKKVLFNLAKERELNNMYKKEREKENVMNKIKYIEEINQNAKEAYDREIKKQNFIIIDENEMERHKNLFLKLYRQRREQQKIDEINKQKEKIRQREIKEKEIKEKEEEKRQKSKEKKEDEKNLFSKSFQLPPVRNPKDRKSLALNNIGDLIMPKIEKEKEKEEKKKPTEEDDEYGSGDFVDISKEDKSKTKSKLDITQKQKPDVDDDLSEKIDMILNGSHTDKKSEQNINENSESYNDFDTSNALEMQGINTINTEHEKDKDKKRNENSENSSEDYKF